MALRKGAEHDKSRPRLFVYSLGLVFQRRVRRILKAHGWQLKFGLPLRDGDAVAVWGRKKTAKRGMAVANHFKRRLITVEDAFLRSVLTGRQNAPSMGIVTDHTGIYFDTEVPSDIDDWLEKSTKLTLDEVTYAAQMVTYMRHLKLSKYNNFTRHNVEICDDFILVVDQTLRDAAIEKGAAGPDTFADMLSRAKLENPDKKILIKTHPETTAGKRLGHFTEHDCDDQVSLLSAQISPWELFEKANKIYCVTSQVGLEAIFAGHKPIVFGRPFYAGLGLTDDRGSARKKPLKCTAEQLFWATHLQYSKWYDPYFDRATEFQSAVRNLHAQSQQHQDSKQPSICLGMRLWKRGFLRQFLSTEHTTPRFVSSAEQAAQLAQKANGRVLAWAGKVTSDLVQQCKAKDVPLVRIEDGFLRSVGLGAQLVAPVSLAFDDQGIYYDPTDQSRLETLLNQSDTLTDMDLARANHIRDRVIALKMTKYNLKANAVTINAAKGQKIILVPGQVEDDASILKGASKVKTNLELLKAARADFPNDYIVYKPHPDVLAGLRIGMIQPNDTAQYADQIVDNGSMAELLDQVDHIATITSLTGFEALIRGKSVTCYGQPFYSGWGLTDDRAAKIKRRKAEVSLSALVHATLIAYPRYWDPITGDACPVEVVLERFERGELQKRGPASIRILAKIQGLFASYAYLWR
ncbi:capsular polysaccharide biosynthesis protein [Amylibacter sp. SFDW26]|uniref:capsular polysaccharide biosynthesis protein n=1 Tax=Amylibacter sp. SFDW26 TaxID=2652722 RepID=UPI00186A815D|nr:capsular polysaccharide biosynthesis protein [Amylibacter sp. SFDW26]